MADAIRTTATRRALLAVLPAAALMPGVTSAATEPKSRIMELFEEWQYWERRANETDFSHLSDKEGTAAIDALVDEAGRCEKAMIAIPAETAEELAAKIYVYTCGGDLGFTDCPEIISDLECILGLKGRAA